MRHDERGSRRSAGCGQVRRREAVGAAEGRHAVWRFLISTEPLLHFLDRDTQSAAPVYPSSLAADALPSNTHKDVGFWYLSHL